DDELVEELRIEGRYRALSRVALGRALAVEQAEQFGRAPDAEAIRMAGESFRAERDLLADAALRQWMSEQRMEDGGLKRFLRRESQARWSESLLRELAHAHLADVLRAEGRYGILAARASEKRQFLRRAGFESAALDEIGVSEAELWEWYFGERLAIAERS